MCMFSSPLNQLWHLTSPLIELNKILTTLLFLHLQDSHDFIFKNYFLIILSLLHPAAWNIDGSILENEIKNNPKQNEPKSKTWEYSTYSRLHLDFYVQEKHMSIFSDYYSEFSVRVKSNKKWLLREIFTNMSWFHLCAAANFTLDYLGRHH